MTGGLWLLDTVSKMGGPERKGIQQADGPGVQDGRGRLGRQQLPYWEQRKAKGRRPGWERGPRQCCRRKETGEWKVEDEQEEEEGERSRMTSECQPREKGH